MMPYPVVFVLMILIISLNPGASGLLKLIGAAEPSVTLSSGVLIGTTSTVSTPTVGTAAVTQFLGIPYASSPPERFAPGEPPAKWKIPLKTQKRKPVCMQQFESLLNLFGRFEDIFNDPGSPPPRESEDCLYVNVFVPPGTKVGDEKTVMFWVFGGNLAFGGGSLHMYDGSSLAYHQDVIVVTHNYRTNVFGFPGSPQLPLEEQNVGFLDQRMALLWTQKNIERFGGDPKKVTIFGESAGGLSVRSLVGNPPRPLPFRAAIMQSEAALCTNAGLPVANTSVGTSWEEICIAMGCLEPLTQLECMRSKPASLLKSIGAMASIEFCPVEDKETFTADIRPALQSGSAAQVPLVIGTNRDEGRFIPFLLGLEDSETAIDIILSSLLPNHPDLVNALAAMTAGKPVSRAIAEVVTAVLFICPASQLANTAQSSGYSIWRYLFEGVFPNQLIFPDAGAYHTSEIFPVFGTYFLSNKFGDATPEQMATSNYMQTAWANFAKNPTEGPGQGWPKLGTEGRVNSIANNGTHTTTAASIDPAICEVLNDIIGQQLI